MDIFRKHGFRGREYSLVSHERRNLNENHHLTPWVDSVLYCCSRRVVSQRELGGGDMRNIAFRMQKQVKIFRKI